MRRSALRGLIIVTALAATVALFATACGGDAQTSTTAVATTAATTSGSIEVSGLVDYPMDFTIVDMDYMDWVTVKAEDPTSGSASYDGVRLSDIWSFFGVQVEAKSVGVTGADGSEAQITLADIGSDALLSVADDDGFNLVMPGMAADAWVKDVVALEFR